MKTKKIGFTAFLIFALLSVLSSCASNPQENQNNTPGENVAGNNGSVENDAEDEFQEETNKFEGLDFGGYEFKIVTRIMQAATNILVETLNGDVVNDAVYERNLEVSEKLNVTFTETQLDSANVVSRFRNTVMAGDNAVDFVIGRGMDMFTLASDGLVNPIHTLSYIDLDEPYWNQKITNELTVQGKTFFAIGELSMSTYDLTHIMLFNKQVHKDHGLEDVYGLVKNGKWTFDKFSEMGRTVTFDVNGDGAMDAEDSYGFVSCYKQVINSFFEAAGIKSIEKTNDGSLYFALPENQKFNDVFDKIFDVTRDIWYVSDLDVNNIGGPVLMEMFTSGRGLFMDCTFYHVRMFRDTECDFGIIPYPKYNEAQPDYYSRVEALELLATPITADNLARTGAVIEMMTIESMKKVIPAYYDVALRYKYTRDEESEEMLDIISKGRVADLGDCIWWEHIRHGIFAPMFLKNDRNVVSALEKNASKVDTLLTQINEAIKSIN